MGLFGHKMSEEEKRRQKWEKDVERMSARLLQVAAAGDVVEMTQLLDGEWGGVSTAGAGSDKPVADPCFVDRYGYTALMHAAKEGHVGATQLLIDRGAELDRQQPEDGSTALHLAACSGETGAVPVLLDAGADASVRMRDGSTALQLAAIVGLGSVVRMFARRGVDVGSELRGVDGVSPSILELVTELEEEAAAAAEPAPQAEDGDDAGAGGSEGSQPQRQLLEDVVGVPMGLGGGGLCAPLPVGALLAPGALDWARVPDSALRRVQAALASGLQAVADEAAAREERRRAEAEAARAEASRVGAVMRGLQGSCAPTYAELFARVGVTPELLEILAEDEDSWLDLWDGDLESVAEADRTSLIAVAPKILEVLAAAGDDSI